MSSSLSNISSSIAVPQQSNTIQKASPMNNTSAISSTLSRVRVIVRVRPKLTIEQNHSTAFLQVQPQTNTIQLSASLSAASNNTNNNNNGSNSNGQTDKNFRFDQVFDANITQHEFSERMELNKIIHSVLEGYHATIFAYGQTGSGKTFTMEGYEYEKADLSLLHQHQDRVQAKAKVDVSSDRLGIIPRAILRLYDEINTMIQTKKREYIVKCSFVQIYNEQIMDLLNPTHFYKGGRGKQPKPTKTNGLTKGLRLRWTAAQDFYVENLTMIECRSPDEVLRRFHEGIKHKIMASHNLNAASSRSHCIFTLYVESSNGAASDDDPTNEVYKSKLALVDLAGSERVDKTGATGITLQESIGINKSLFVLRQVIQALAEEAGNSNTDEGGGIKAYIPYRDSKLTSLLKYSLGGNSITLMIACLSPSDSYFDENMSTLMYAAKAQSIANKPIRNDDPKTLLIQQLREEVESLKAQLAQAQSIVLALQTGGTTDHTRSGAANDHTCTKCKHDWTSSVTIGGLSVPPGTAHTTPSLPAAPTSSSPKKATAALTNTVAASAVGEQQPPSHSNTSAPASTNSNSALTNRLKMNVIDNVSLIKQLYETEKKLREQVTSQGNQLEQFKHETRVLNVENQSLREKMEVLEYLLQQQSQDPEDVDNNNTAEDKEDGEEEEDEEIPEYGRLSRKSKSSSSLSSMPVPSQAKIRQVLKSKATPVERDTGASAPVSGTQKAPAGVSQKNRVLNDPSSSVSTSGTKKPQDTTGLLSINDLKDLLSGGGKTKDMKSNTRTGGQSGGKNTTAVAGLTDTLDMFQASKSAHSTSSNRRPIDVTQNLLNTLESTNTESRRASTTGTTRSMSDQTTTSNTFDRDALDSLSELNRLLRVKATLRRAASTGGSGTGSSGVPQTSTMF